MTKYPLIAGSARVDPDYVPPSTTTPLSMNALINRERKEAVSQFISELDKIPGPIHHSDLERIKRELGYIK